MELKRCPVCYTVLEKRNESYYCPVCNVVFPKRLKKKVLVFGITRKYIERRDVAIQKMDETYIVIPLRSGRVIMPRSFQYYKTLIKKLLDVGVDYICVDMYGRFEHLPFPVSNRVEKVLLVGIDPIVTCKVRNFYIVVGSNQARICASDLRKYKDLYGLLLFVSSYT